MTLRQRLLQLWTLFKCRKDKNKFNLQSSSLWTDCKWWPLINSRRNKALRQKERTPKDQRWANSTPTIKPIYLMSSTRWVTLPRQIILKADCLAQKLMRGWVFSVGTSGLTRGNSEKTESSYCSRPSIKMFYHHRSKTHPMDTRIREARKSLTYHGKNNKENSIKSVFHICVHHHYKETNK